MSTLYVLLLEKEKYYIGRTYDLDKRLIDHSNGNGSEWTSLYKVIKVIEIIKNCKPQDEDAMTITYMTKYGIENVRGGTFCNIILSKDTIKFLEKMINTQTLTCYNCNEKGHYANDCKIRKNIESVTCYKCGKKGHYANKCFEPKQITKENIQEKTIEQIHIKNESKIIGNVALKSHHNKWLCFDNPKRSSIISADRDNIGEFEKFVVYNTANEEIKLFCPKHSTYLAATNQGDVYQSTDAANIDVLWKIEPVSINIKNGKIEKAGFLHAKNKKYLCAERLSFFGFGKVVANRDALKSFETWELCYL